MLRGTGFLLWTSFVVSLHAKGPSQTEKQNNKKKIDEVE